MALPKRWSFASTSACSVACPSCPARERSLELICEHALKSENFCLSSFRKTLKIKGQKRTPKPKNRTNSTKELSEQFDGVTGHDPVKQGF